MRGVYFYSNSRYGFFALVLFFRPALYHPNLTTVVTTLQGIALGRGFGS
jgi:hypothetical protein